MLRNLKNIFYSATTSPDTTIFAIGDVHGYLDALKALCHKIDAYRAKHPNKHVIEVFLGDYVNRGPQSYEVIQFLIERGAQKDGVKRVFLGGNHDIAFKRLLKEQHKHKSIHITEEMFYNYGGPETLASYGVPMRTFRFPERNVPNSLIKGTSLYVDRNCLNIMREELIANVPVSHLMFLESLRPSFTNGKYLFAHAGVDPEVEITKQNPNVLRGLDEGVREFAKYKGRLENDMVVVHGHTISHEPYYSHNQVSLDTGIYKAGHGHLTCAVLTASSVKFLQAKTKHPAFDAKTSRAMATAKDFVLN